MRKEEAKRLAERVTTSELKQMLFNAKRDIKNWTDPSRSNKGISRGAAFNIFAKCVDTKSKLAITNMLVEFGEHLPNYTPVDKIKKDVVKPTHQEPIDITDLWNSI